MAQTHTHTYRHGDSMTNSAQWGRVGENENNINYNHILNGTVLEQRNAINYIVENQIEE